MAMEGCISGLEDKLHPLAHESHSTTQLARVSSMRAKDIENQLLQNNVCIVGPPGKVEGSDPMDFTECWLW